MSEARRCAIIYVYYVVLLAWVYSYGEYCTVLSATSLCLLSFTVFCFVRYINIIKYLSLSYFLTLSRNPYYIVITITKRSDGCPETGYYYFLFPWLGNLYLQYYVIPNYIMHSPTRGVPPITITGRGSRGV